MKEDTCTTNLTGHFLIAMPSLNDSAFGNTITYICEHNEQGAMGLVINHPLQLNLDDVFAHLNIEDITTAHTDHILAGGPVQTERGFVLHEQQSNLQWEGTQTIADDICLTTSQDILTDIAHNKGPEHSLVALGYAGWGAGQLEEEIAQNAWLTTPADNDIIFRTPIERRASAAAAQLGIDLTLISPQAGHS
ncbi:MAG: putative transcriptional regulator [Pseudohongiellaceae bacterium]|jgi:putative transcriptional regulator